MTQEDRGKSETSPLDLLLKNKFMKLQAQLEELSYPQVDIVGDLRKKNLNKCETIIAFGLVRRVTTLLSLNYFFQRFKTE